jgi:hypothetical protein
MLRRPRILLTAMLATACTSAKPVATNASASSDYLYLWTASADSTQPDFLAVLDIRPDSGRYGRLVTTLPVPGHSNHPHHTEHELPADRQLFANGFGSGQTFIFDLSKPAEPRIAAQFGDIQGYMHPHSFLRLPNGNVLATFQMQHDSTGMVAGGLVEMTSAGQVVRSSSGNYPGADPGLRVYSAGIVPPLDRIVTTTSDMDGDFPASRNLQVWRLSDLTLLHTFPLPDGPAGGEGLYTAEPRVLEDGRTVLVSTFNCGLYLMEGLDTDTPSGRLVASFPRKEGTNCAIPVVTSHWYLVTVPAWNAVVALDIADPVNPREVSRLTLGPDDVPHWIALEPNRQRLVITGYGALRHRVLIATFDSATGQLALDERFRVEGATEPGFRMDDKTWPHGGNAKGIPHGAVFSRP